jgi:hypothetical protein
MARDLPQRFQTSRELWRALRAYLTERGLSASPDDVAAYLGTVFGHEIDTLRREVYDARDRALRGDVDGPPTGAARSAGGRPDAVPVPAPGEATVAPEPLPAEPSEAGGPRRSPLPVYLLWAAAITLGFALAFTTIWILEHR